jgi:CO dehydrogenase/acetyl-CoA synthase beta subunit
VSSKKILERIKEFVKKEGQKGKEISIYKKDQNPSNFFKKYNIKIELDNCKEIILQEETKIELGGIKKKSFSLIYPTNELGFIENGKIRLIGPEIKDISESNIDFGMLVIIGHLNTSENLEKDIDNLKQFSFISNGIEGFLIRSIPRKFWCRISSEVIIKSFSFEILGNAIMYLYKQKFKDLIESMEILFINSYPSLIDEFIKITSEIREEFSTKWKKKIEEWKKRIGCDYDWGCEICPYQSDCYEIKEVLVERAILDEREEL